jgi:hypothetical protein
MRPANVDATGDEKGDRRELLVCVWGGYMGTGNLTLSKRHLGRGGAGDGAGQARRCLLTSGRWLAGRAEDEVMPFVYRAHGREADVQPHTEPTVPFSHLG